MATTVYYATNRRPGTIPTDFGSDLSTSSTPLYGEASVQTVTPFNSVQELRSSTIGSGDIRTRDYDEVEPVWSTEITRGHDLLIYVHGYYTTFNDSLKEAAAIKDEFVSASSRERTVIVFGWPSNGSLDAYLSDRSDAAASGPALADLLRKVAKVRANASSSASPGNVHLIAQSMGKLRAPVGNSGCSRRLESGREAFPSHLGGC